MEEMVEGLNVRLYKCVSGNQQNPDLANYIDQAITDTNGYYTFDVTPSDTDQYQYYIEFRNSFTYKSTVREACDPAFDSDTNEFGQSDCLLLTGGDTTQVDMGVVANMVVGGNVFVDGNANGIHNVGEETLGEVGKVVIMNLYSETDNLISSTDTDSDGGYYFEAVPGNYYLEFLPPASAPISSALTCLLYTSPSPRDATLSRMPSSA